MRIFQHLVYLISRILLILNLVKYKDVLGGVDAAKPHVVAVNHLSKFDAYFSIASISFKNYLKLRLFRFMTYNKYLEGFTGVIIRLSGAFPAKPAEGESYGLEASKQFLKENQTIVIFPEGRIVRPGVDYRIHSGVAVLAKEPNVKVIPIHIKARDKSKPNKVFNNLEIVVGQAFDGHKMTAEQIMRKVYEL